MLGLEQTLASNKCRVSRRNAELTHVDTRYVIATGKVADELNTTFSADTNNPLFLQLSK